MTEHHPRSISAIQDAEWRRLAADYDAANLRRCFLGIWPDRESLGQELLAEERAIERARLAVPRWLADYVRLDGAAFAADQEADGVFVVREIENGVCVFDGTSLLDPAGANSRIAARKLEAHNC